MVGLPLAQFLGGLLLVGAQYGEQRDYSRVNADHQSIGFLALVVAQQQPAGAAGQIRHIRAPLIQDQVKAGAQPVPPPTCAI